MFIIGGALGGLFILFAIVLYLSSGGGTPIYNISARYAAITGEHGQTVLQINHGGGEIIDNASNIGVVVFHSDPVAPLNQNNRLANSRAINLKTFAPGDSLYVYIDINGTPAVSKTLPSYSDSIDFNTGRWNVSLVDMRYNALISEYSYLLPSTTLTIVGDENIQAAIDRSGESPTIIVSGTIYRERITIPKTLRLISFSWPIIDGGNLHSVITVSGEKVTVKGFDIRNSGNKDSDEDSGILMTSTASQCYVTQNVIRDSLDGIRLARASNNIIVNNTVVSNDNNGIHINGGFYNTLKYNVADGNGYSGIYLESSDGNTVRDNWASENTKYGIYIKDYASQSNVCEYNYGSNNTFECNDAAVRT